MALETAIDITTEERETILALLQQYLPGTVAWVYGSRVTGTSTPKSDLDLIVLATPEQRRQVGDLREAFEESNLPFRVDLFVWDDVPESFRGRIETEHVVIASATEQCHRNGWHETTLERLGRIVTGKTPPSGRPEYFGGQIPFITPTDFDGRREIATTNRHLTSAGADVVKRSRVPAGAVLVSCIGSDMGKAAVAYCESVTNQQINSVLCNSNNSALFLYYNLRARRAEIRAAASGSAQPILNKSAFGKLSILLPPISEQRAIARILGTLDDKIELNRRMNATLEAMARALFKSWFVDFDPVRAKMEGRDTGLPKEVADLFPDRLVDSELGEIPDRWDVATLGDHVVNFDSKRIPVSGAVRAERSGPYPYHGAAGVLDHVADYIFDGVFLLIGEDGSVMRENGLAVTQYVYGKFWVNNHAHVLQGAGPVSTEQAYLHFSFEPVAPLVTGAVQPKLSQSRMKCVPFLFAGDDICRAFAEMVQPWFAQLRWRTEETRILAEMRDELLPILVSGRLQVSIEDAPRLDARHPRRATSEGAA